MLEGIGNPEASWQLVYEHSLWIAQLQSDVNNVILGSLTAPLSDQAWQNPLLIPFKKAEELLETQYTSQ